MPHRQVVMPVLSSVPGNVVPTICVPSSEATEGVRCADSAVLLSPYFSATISLTGRAERNYDAA